MGKSNGLVRICQVTRFLSAGDMLAFIEREKIEEPKVLMKCVDNGSGRMRRTFAVVRVLKEGEVCVGNIEHVVDSSEVLIPVKAVSG